MHRARADDEPAELAAVVPDVLSLANLFRDSDRIVDAHQWPQQTLEDISSQTGRAV